MTVPTEFAARLIAEHIRVRTGIAGSIGRIAGLLLRELGPYAAIELILPGGSLLALLLWLYRRHRKAGSETVMSKPSRPTTVASQRLPETLQCCPVS